MGHLIKKNQNVSKGQFWFLRSGAGLVSVRGRNVSKDYFGHKWLISIMERSHNVSKGSFWFSRIEAVVVPVWSQK